MHEPVIQRLEEYLDGGGPFREVEEHLSKCNSCKEELDAMRAQTALFRMLRSESEPNPGFYARVTNRIEAQSRPSVWSLFGESMFARRLAYASATFMVLVGVVFFSANQPEQPLVSADPEIILGGDARYTPVSMDLPQDRDREVVLVNLATYQQTSQDYQ
jgi:anti-sigma factor RsiW